MNRFGPRSMVGGAASALCGTAPVLCGAALALLGFALPAGAQTATVAVEEENFRSEPGGSIIAEVLEGARLELGATQGQWREATLEAWIWGASVAEQDRPELDLLVNAGGENLRATPNGERIGRALGGMRLARLETRGDWLRVRRTGWIWSPSIEVMDDAPPASAEGDPPASPAGDPPAAADPVAEPPAAARERAREFAVAAEDAIILDTPAGDTVARLSPGSSVEVVEREGAWARVRIEGWTFSGALSGGEDAGAGILEGIDRDSLQARPEEFRGRLVEWSVQFIALQEAERFRTDFLEGEPFMLTRGPDDDPGFVYVAVSADLIDEVEALSPLQRIRILARVRTVRSMLTGAPVLDLLEITSR